MVCVHLAVTCRPVHHGDEPHESPCEGDRVTDIERGFHLQLEVLEVT